MLFIIFPCNFKANIILFDHSKTIFFILNKLTLISVTHSLLFPITVFLIFFPIFGLYSMPTSTLQSLDLPEDLRDTLNQYLGRLQKDWGADLKGLLLYGSAARGDSIAGRSNINFLVLVREHSVSGLQRAGQLHRQWGKHQIVAPSELDSRVHPQPMQRSPRPPPVGPAFPNTVRFSPAHWWMWTAQ